MPPDDGELRRLRGADGGVGKRPDAGGKAAPRRVTDGGNGKNWRFSMGFSVNSYGDSDGRQLRDHHLRRQFGYNRNRALPHFDPAQNGSTGNTKI
jgi:hypothetical protein